MPACHGRHARPRPRRRCTLPAVAVTAGLAGSTLVPVAASASVVSAGRAVEPMSPRLARPLAYGAKNVQVRQIQAKLGVRPLSGWFGPKTTAAVKRFQRTMGLPATGRVDGVTWGRLRSMRARTPLPVARQVLEVAAELAGTPYRWGGTTPSGFDCSGYTGYVFDKAGIDLPRTSREQRAAVAYVSPDDVQPGDLVFSHDSSGTVYHVGIVAGDGEMWDSPRPGKRVARHPIYGTRLSYGRPA